MGKDSGVLFRLNYSILQQTSIGYVSSSSQKLFSILLLACVCAQPLSLFRTASRRLDRLAYIEIITGAYSRYFVNDIELIENNK